MKTCGTYWFTAAANTAEGQLGVELIREASGTVQAVPLEDPRAVERLLVSRLNLGRGTLEQRTERAAEKAWEEKIHRIGDRERIGAVRSKGQVRKSK